MMIKKAVWFVTGWRLDCSSSGLGSSDLEFPKSFGRILENSFFGWVPEIRRFLQNFGNLFSCQVLISSFVPVRKPWSSPRKLWSYLTKKPSSEYFGNYFSELCLILFCLFPFSAKPIRAGHHPGVANPAVSSLHTYCTGPVFEMVGRKMFKTWLWS